MLRILRGAGFVEPKTWCGEAEEIERLFAEAAGQKLEVLIVLGGDGTIEPLQKYAPKRDPISFRFPWER
jgi:diacylglycerol kinase family enzyme